MLVYPLLPGAYKTFFLSCLSSKLPTHYKKHYFFFQYMGLQTMDSPYSIYNSVEGVEQEMGRMMTIVCLRGIGCARSLSLDG